ncbi:MAG: DUF1080 domain-containing protein [Betaproteobacteria bacterium]|nr:DUF1080 domain-containing protein [Betaproteobacteria bacterium]
MKRMAFITTGLLVIAFTLFGCAQQPAAPTGAGWITLIDGPKGLDNWNRQGTANWRVVDGVMQADSAKGNSWLVSKNSYADFQLRVEFWASDNANSGVYLRCRDAKKVAVTSCYEVNIYDRAPDPAFGTGAIVRFATVQAIHKAGGKWNTYEITAKGTKITATLNGVRTVELDNKKYKSGPIALQWFGGVVKFRKVQIRPL